LTLFPLAGGALLTVFSIPPWALERLQAALSLLLHRPELLSDGAIGIRYDTANSRNYSLEERQTTISNTIKKK